MSTASAVSAIPKATSEDVKRYEFEVKMHCGGCSGAVERVLGKLEGSSPSPPPPLYDSARSNADPRIGVRSYTTDLTTQKVNVTTVPTLGLEAVTAVIKKTGKEIVSSKEV